MVRLTRTISSRLDREHNFLWQMNLIRFLLPLTLFLIVAVFETEEHWLDTGVFEVRLVSEITFFGILGPTAVFFILTYIKTLMKQLIAAREETEAINRSLEKTVAARTADLAERNAELATANQELTQLDQMKSNFVSLVSHELKGPLTTLNGGLELALQSHDMSDKTRRVLTLMAQESQRLTQFVQTILDVSQVEAGKLQLNMGPIAVRPLLERAVAGTLPENGRRVMWQVTPDLPPVWADEIYFEESIRNLLTNADKYTPPEAPVAIGAYMDDACLHITITDFGPGIPSSVQPYIFDQFHREQTGDQIATRGWGLGLHFAKTLTEAQGGSLTLQSPVRDDPQAPGATFTLLMPFSEEVPADGEFTFD